jgi:hypothetical protein
MIKSIELKEKGGRVQFFTTGHAVRLLSIKNSVWSIPSDSEFEFVENAIRKKPGSGNLGEETKKKTVTKRRKTSKPS